MKKYLTLALAMPLLFACSNDLDNIEKGNVSNDSFAGIEKVDATFTMADDQPTTRTATNWGIETNDMYGFAWLGDGTVINPSATGKAYQNHPLYVTAGEYFKPETSIYVGKYYLYLPYDYETVNIGEINFKSLKEQEVKQGQSSAGQGWKSIAKYAINIGDKWTDVTTTGRTIVGKDGIWDKAGIGENYDIYGATFSNQTGLELNYVKNNPIFDGKTIVGASDINYTYPENSDIGAADIYDGVTVQLEGAKNSFTYAPKSEPNNDDHNGKFWADKSGATGKGVEDTDGFTFPETVEPVTLNFEDGKISTTKVETTGDLEGKAWFWFNSLPKQAGDAALDTKVTVVLPTTYGEVTVNSTLEACAYVLDKYDGTGNNEWIKLANADDNTVTPKTWNIAETHNTFVNQYGNHRGKYALDVDFSTGVIDGMCIENDAHLQKVLKYYIASGKTDTGVNLKLDPDSEGEFKLSKLSIALLQTINASGTKVLLRRCTTHGIANIVITQEGQDAIAELADKQEVPTFNNVFAYAYDVYLSKDYTWTLSKDYSATKLNSGNVKSITNLGTLNVTSLVVNTTANCDFVNANEMNVTAKVDFAQNLENTGTINIASNAWLRAAGASKTIINQAGTAHGVNWGKIDNKGELSVKAGVTDAAVHNFGYIKNNDGAITFVTTNERGATIGTTANFANAFAKASNAFGEIEMVNPTDYASVSNGDAAGFITYEWNDASYVTPNASYKFNYLKIAGNIEFGKTLGDTKIKFLEFNGTSLQTVQASGEASLKELRGIYVKPGSSFILDVKNSLKAKEAVYVAGEIKVGGELSANGPTNSKYFGTTSNLGNISVWGGGTLH